jgi:AcrR family transcriptional regulator
MTVRAERVPAEEVRQRMLDAGRELAVEAGAALTIEHLRLEEVIQRARVPRSSVYRQWPYKDDYIDDLMCYLAGPGSWFHGGQLFDPETFTIVRQVIEDNTALLSTLEGRRALLCEATRVGAARNTQTLTDSPAWRLHMALLATLGSTRSGEARRKIAAALEQSQLASRKSLIGLFEYLRAAIGLRERDPARTIGHMVLAGGITIQGFALRNVQTTAAAGDPDAAVVDELLNRPIPGPGLDGKPAPWSLVAYSYLALLDAFLDLDPDWKPPATGQTLLLAAGQFQNAVAEHRDAR